MRESRSLDDLLPAVRLMALEHERLCNVSGFQLLIYCTYRDAEWQQYLWEFGREKPGAIVTYAKPGESMHQYRVAYDAIPVLGGKALWKDEERIRTMGELGERAGLEWAGRWTGRLRERVHFQAPWLKEGGNG